MTRRANKPCEMHCVGTRVVAPSQTRRHRLIDAIGDVFGVVRRWTVAEAEAVGLSFSSVRRTRLMAIACQLERRTQQRVPGRSLAAQLTFRCLRAERGGRRCLMSQLQLVARGHQSVSALAPVLLLMLSACAPGVSDSPAREATSRLAQHLILRETSAVPLPAGAEVDGAFIDATGIAVLRGGRGGRLYVVDTSRVVAECHPSAPRGSNALHQRRSTAGGYVTHVLRALAELGVDCDTRTGLASEATKLFGAVPTTEPPIRAARSSVALRRGLQSLLDGTGLTEHPNDSRLWWLVVGPTAKSAANTRWPFGGWVRRFDSGDSIRVEHWNRQVLVAAELDSVLASRTRGLGIHALDDGFVQTIVDPQSDIRILVRYDSSGAVANLSNLNTAFGIAATDPDARKLLALRRTNGTEAVWYAWRWSAP